MGLIVGGGVPVSGRPCAADEEGRVEVEFSEASLMGIRCELNGRSARIHLV